MDEIPVLIYAAGIGVALFAVIRFAMGKQDFLAKKLEVKHKLQQQAREAEQVRQVENDRMKEIQDRAKRQYAAQVKAAAVQAEKKKSQAATEQ